MNKILITGLATFALAAALRATEFHVAITGNNAGTGTLATPLRTIQHAADLAQPGDVITVHAGTYRERINPPRGGTSDSRRIIYQAAAGDKVVITGSEVVTNWVKIQADVWQAILPNSFFGGFNPFNDLIHGDWFQDRGRQHHTGAVYLNGEWLTEAAHQEDVMNPAGTNALWFAVVDATNTTIWAQFKEVNPNGQLVEVNTRQSVFYPEKIGVNFITVRGFTMRQAATPWAPPTAEQIGLIGTHWSQGWIIESNIISYSVCSGITLGKYGDEFDNTSANSAECYVKTIERAHAFTIPWTRENIGHHIIRNNTISHCEQAGIVGSLGAAYSTITGNTIHDIHVRQLFTGCEQAGIKFHGAIDTEICGNHIYRAYRGLWLDWMAQGTRVSGNLFHDNSAEDIYVEVNHGPFIVDNNLLLSARSLWDMSEGGAFVHNLMAGKIDNWYDMSRFTPYLQPHSTSIAGLAMTKGGDNRFYNNLFVGQNQSGTMPLKDAKPTTSITGFGLWVYDSRVFPLQTGGNVYGNGAGPYFLETNHVISAEGGAQLRLVEEGDAVFLCLTLDPVQLQSKTRLVTTELLGKAKVSGCVYLNSDGTRLEVDRDYFGNKRNRQNPSAGPFENVETGSRTVQVWPKN